MLIPGESIELHLEKIKKNMPAVCRCTGYSLDIPPEVPAQIIVDRFLAYSIDAFIRNANTIAGSQKRHVSIHDAWLQTLVSEDACN